MEPQVQSLYEPQNEFKIKLGHFVRLFQNKSAKRNSDTAQQQSDFLGGGEDFKVGMHVFNIYEPALPLIPSTTKQNKTNKINSDFRSISPTPSSQFSHAWIKHQLQSLFEGKNCLYSKHLKTFPLLFPKQYSIMIIHIVFICYKVTQVICNFLKYTTGYIHIICRYYIVLYKGLPMSMDFNTL